jgi:hypothetical protein
MDLSKAKESFMEYGSRRRRRRRRSIRSIRQKKDSADLVKKFAEKSEEIQKLQKLAKDNELLIQTAIQWNEVNKNENVYIDPPIQNWVDQNAFVDHVPPMMLGIPNPQSPGAMIDRTPEHIAGVEEIKAKYPWVIKDEQKTKTNG